MRPRPAARVREADTVAPEGGAAPGSVTVVVPVHNEVDTIEGVVRGLWEEVVSKLEDAELVVAEDGSTDGTKELLALLATDVPFRLVSGAERKGYLRGLRDALLLADKEWVFYCDSDGTHDPADFWNLWARREGVDLVLGEKVRRQDPAYRLAFSRAYNLLVAGLFGVRARDVNGGFKLLRRGLLETCAAPVRHLPFGFSTELVVRAHHAGARIARVPVKHYAREHGKADQFEPRAMPRVVWRQWRGLLALRRELLRG